MIVKDEVILRARISSETTSFCEQLLDRKVPGYLRGQWLSGTKFFCELQIRREQRYSTSSMIVWFEIILRLPWSP